MPVFSYLSYDVTDPELAAVFKRRLATDSKNFCRWQSKSANRIADTGMLRLFELWWRWAGPTGFRTREDSLRYKADLWQFVSITEPQERNIAQYADTMVIS